MNFKFVTPVVFLLLFGLLGHSQNYKFIYYFDNNFNTVKKSVAAFVGKGYQDQNAFVLDCYDAVSDKLVTSSHFTDSSLAVLDGFYQVFYANGKPESEGYFKNNLREGAWIYWNDLGQQVDSMAYDAGVRTKFASYSHLDKNSTKLSSYSYTDSMANTYIKLQYDTSGVIVKEARFLGSHGLLTTYTNGKVEVDSVFTREEQEANFPGPDGAWTKYVMTHMNHFNPGELGAPYGKYQVIIKFTIDTTGAIVDVIPETNFGYKMEETIIKMIQKAPRWNPAVQFGKKISAYRRQPMTFAVSGD